MVQRATAARQARRNGEYGFTLVELLVVIVILGILAAIVVFAVGGITDKGTTAANKTTCSVIQTAEEAYYAQHSAYVLDGGGKSGQQKLKEAGFLHSDNPDFTIVTAVAPDVGYTINGPSGAC